MRKERVLTGIRSNGQPHLGNYLGAMRPMVTVQRRESKTHDMFFFVPDLHSFTTPINHETLYENTIRNLRFFIAAGMDFWAEGAYLYRQSYIPAHCELTWILDCFAYYGELSRMIQFKEKSSQHDQADSVSVGLFNYPVLMAADILLYEPKYVPVGDDQRQHLELTRDLALRLNNKFANEYPAGVFRTVPVEWDRQVAFAEREAGGRVRSLRDPNKKMSKSITDPAGTIDLMDEPAVAAKKVMGATTDSVGKIAFDWETQPGISNLLEMLSLLSNRPLTEIITQWQGGTSYGDLKQTVAQEVEQFLGDFQAKVAAVDEAKLVAKLESDEATMRAIANETLARVQQAVGLRPR